jgi:hypothetical protein
VTVLEEGTTKDEHPVVLFLWAKGLSAKDIHKDILSVYGGKCLSCKAVRNWVEKFSQGRSKATDDARPGAELAETTVERLVLQVLTSKVMGQMHQS